MSAWGTKLRAVPRAGAARLGQLLLRPKLREEAGSAHFQLNERAVEYSFALGALGQVSGREVLDVGTTGELWTHGERLQPPRPSSAEGPHHLGCFVLEASGS